ncbi:MAG: hydrogenase nickel incorporation protein HypB [Chloroflexi bacterium]|jgi:hydrogenase nickel incorporation protein HypB|nr:hydrogenase nickel incorporation protein HypB [Chloroflexota bacterium]
MSRIPVVERIMKANDDVAASNRQLLDEHGVHAVNIIAAPGAGKTSLILAVSVALAGRVRVGVIEGDLASDVDAQKVRAAGLPVYQINTGGGCHLDARQVRVALDQMPLDEIDLLLIENVGNLVCPVNFVLGEHTRLGISSVPEGDDKPHKYPTIFANVDALALNKADLLAFMPFDVAEFERLVRSLNPEIAVFQVSSTVGTGIDALADWLAGLAA